MRKRLIAAAALRELGHPPRLMFIDAVVVSGPLKNGGLGRALLADFCARMASQGVPLIMTHLYLPGFFLRHGFKLDKRWGALVKTL